MTEVLVIPEKSEIVKSQIKKHLGLNALAGFFDFYLSIDNCRFQIVDLLRHNDLLGYSILAEKSKIVNRKLKIIRVLMPLRVFRF